MLYDMTWASPTDENFYTDATRQPATATFKSIYTQDYGFDHVNHYNMLVELTEIKVDTIRWEDRATWNNRHKTLGDLPLTEQHKSVLIESVNHTRKDPLSITAAE